jgi:Xanthosine triphosphate pyrophosphatase
LFEGICEGQITTAVQGSGGFGYDPVFVPDGDKRSFAQMTLEEKISIATVQKPWPNCSNF